MEQPDNPLGTQLRKVRKQMRLNQRDFALVVGQCERYVREWENGRKRPNDGIIKSIEAWCAKEKAAVSLEVLKTLLTEPALAREAKAGQENKENLRAGKALDGLEVSLRELLDRESRKEPVKREVDMFWALMIETDTKVLLSGRPSSAADSRRWSAIQREVTAMMMRLDDAEDRALEDWRKSVEHT